MRAPFQVLVFPYHCDTADRIRYAIFSRSDYSCWQGIAGGGEDGESPLDAARRECFEEAGISSTCDFIQLDSTCSIPITHFADSHEWGDDIYVIPEYSFGVRVEEVKLRLSSEHRTAYWVSFDEAMKLLTYDSNRTALWELNERMKKP